MGQLLQKGDGAVSREYSDIMRSMALPMNYRAHLACLLLEHLGYRFCVDYGYANAEEILRRKQLADMTEEAE